MRYCPLLQVACVGLLAVSGLIAGAAAPRRPVTAPRARNPQNLIVRLRPDAARIDQPLDDLRFVRTVRTLLSTDMLVVQPAGVSEATAFARLGRDPRVASVSRDRPLVVDLEPNDRTFSRQWALQSIQAPWAWEITRGNTGVIVGVLDSGVDLTHPDLAAHVLPIGCNLVADSQCGTDGRGTPPQDEDGHGTSVAGIVAAVSDNREGIAGIAWNASILPVKITSDGKGLESNFIAGLIWAVDHGARVLNFSFSEDCGAPETPALRDALAYAWNHGAIMIASAGNEGGCAAGLFPGADTRVLAVAATDANDKPTPTSNFGPWVRVAAPGDKILSTWAHGQYAVGSGTSLAAPQVAGLAALLMSLPGATNQAALNWILSTCDVPDGWNPAFGCGRVNAYRAVALAARGSDPHTSPTAPVTVHLQQGWNNLLYVGPSRQPDVALASLKGKLSSVYTWDPVRAAWAAFLPGQPAASDLALVQERGAYWLFMQAEADLTVSPTGTDPPPQLTLAAGWNNLALPPGNLPAALGAFASPVPSVFSWDVSRGAWRGFFADPAAPSDLDAIRPDRAYWVYARAPLIVRFK